MINSNFLSDNFVQNAINLIDANFNQTYLADEIHGKLIELTYVIYPVGTGNEFSILD